MRHEFQSFSNLAELNKKYCFAVVHLLLLTSSVKHCLHWRTTVLQGFRGLIWIHHIVQWQSPKVDISKTNLLVLNHDTLNMDVAAKKLQSFTHGWFTYILDSRSKSAQLEGRLPRSVLPISNSVCSQMGNTFTISIKPHLVQLAIFERTHSIRILYSRVETCFVRSQ